MLMENIILANASLVLLAGLLNYQNLLRKKKLLLELNDEHEKIDVNSVRSHSEVELTMKALKKKICDIVTIDNFITYENGNLVK